MHFRISKKPLLGVITMFEDIFADNIKDVKASIRIPANSKGVSATVKLETAPAGAIDDDKAWVKASEKGVTVSERIKEQSGRTRTKSLKTGNEATCRKVAQRALGLKETTSTPRSGQADTVPSDNGELVAKQ